MRLQTRFQFDASLLGLEGKYQPIGSDSFLIKSECVKVKHNVVKTGNTYILFDRTKIMKATGTAIKLVDSFYYLNEIYLLVVDLFRGRVMLRNHTLENELTICQWRLVDTDSIEEMTDRKYGR